VRDDELRRKHDQALAQAVITFVGASDEVAPPWRSSRLSTKRTGPSVVSHATEEAITWPRHHLRRWRGRGIQEVSVTTGAELRQARETTVRKHYEAENRHDLDGLLATFSPSRASYDIPAFGEAGAPADAAAVREMWEGILVVFPDIHHEVLRLRHGDDCIVVEYIVSGTQKADWAGIPATGRSFRIRVAAVYEFEAEELVCERVYTDVAGWIRQLGSSD
jgi:steroid delta-isomerase-like uncharacterized protein